MAIKLSLLISVFSGRDEQFRSGLASLTRHSYDRSQVELLVFVDYPQSDSTQNIIREFADAFAAVRMYCVDKKLTKIAHSAGRRNFLAQQARGEYIIFSEPEMFHCQNTLEQVSAYLRTHHDEKTWLTGQVYAGRDMVNEQGLLVDECIQPTSIAQSIMLLNQPNVLTNRKFQKNFFLIDNTYYQTPFFFAVFNRGFFISIGGLNQHLQVRGFEEIELHQRFVKYGGRVVILDTIPTVHIPHRRNFHKETQISWNLYNSTVLFDQNQPFGQITDAQLSEVVVK